MQIASATPVRALCLTPRTLIQVRTSERRRDHERAARGTLGARPDLADRLGEPGGEARGDRHARDPRHPSDFEPDELAESRRRVDVGAAGPVEEARRLGEAQDEQEHGDAREEHGPDARGAEHGRGGGGQQVDAAADHFVDREPDDLPPRDRADEGGLPGVGWAVIARHHRAELRNRSPDAAGTIAGPKP